MPRSHKDNAQHRPERTVSVEPSQPGKEPDGSTAAEVASVEVEGLESRIEELERRVEEEHNLYLRTLADFQNFRRRQEEEIRQLRQFSNRELILGLLPVLDNFERALAAAEQNH